MVGFPLLLIPLAIYNIIVFLMPGVSFTDPLVKLALVSGAEWTVTLSDVPAGADSPLKSVEIIIQNTVTGYTLRQTTLMGQWASGSSDDAASLLPALPMAGGGP